MKTLILAAVLLTGVVAVAGEEKPPTIEESAEFFVRDGGEWRCANPDFVEGGKQPREYGYSFRWAMHKRAVILEIFGAFDGGKKVTYWLNVSTMHPVEKRVVMSHYGVGGAVMQGYELMPDAGTREHFFEGVDHEGKEFRFRDITHITGPDTHTSTSFIWKDGDWQQQQTLEWRRAMPAAGTLQ